MKKKSPYNMRMAPPNRRGGAKQGKGSAPAPNAPPTSGAGPGGATGRPAPGKPQRPSPKAGKGGGRGGINPGGMYSGGVTSQDPRQAVRRPSNTKYRAGGKGLSREEQMQLKQDKQDGTGEYAEGGKYGEAYKRNQEREALTLAQDGLGSNNPGINNPGRPSRAQGRPGPSRRGRAKAGRGGVQGSVNASKVVPRTNQGPGQYRQLSDQGPLQGPQRNTSRPQVRRSSPRGSKNQRGTR